MNAKIIMFIYPRKEFEDHGLSDLITVECRDVCKDGFGITGLVHAGNSYIEINITSNFFFNFLSIYYKCFWIYLHHGKQFQQLKRHLRLVILRLVNPFGLLIFMLFSF